ncbi:MAG TPA: CDP-archaeol synthase [Coriobacteriia bacterium]
MKDAPIRQLVKQQGALKGFIVRTLTALVLGIILLAADLFGGVMGWAVVVALVAALCASEFYQVMRSEHHRANELLGVMASAIMPIAAAIYATRATPGIPGLAIGASSASELGAVGLTAVVGGLILAALVWNIAFRRVKGTDTSTTVFGAMYAGFTLSHLVLVRALDSGAEIIVIILASVWAMDVFAYFIGSAIGTHRLAPHISPKKTWEGFAAGTVGTVAAWTIGWYLIHTSLPLWWFVVTGLVVSVAALLGDLAESRLKREMNVKDSGRLLPGHGGFLDRFDSLIVVSVVVYYLMLLGGAH